MATILRFKSETPHHFDTIAQLALDFDCWLTVALLFWKFTRQKPYFMVYAVVDFNIKCATIAQLFVISNFCYNIVIKKHWKYSVVSKPGRRSIEKFESDIRFCKKKITNHLYTLNSSINSTFPNSLSRSISSM